MHTIKLSYTIKRKKCIFQTYPIYHKSFKINIFIKVRKSYDCMVFDELILIDRTKRIKSKHTSLSSVRNIDIDFVIQVTNHKKNQGE